MNIRSGHHQTCGEERKKKRLPQMNEKASRNQTLHQESHQTDKHLGCLPCKIRRTIFKMGKRTQTNRPEEKKADDNAQGLTPER